MKAMSVNPQHKPKVKKVSIKEKPLPWREQLLRMGVGNVHTVDANFLDNLGIELVQWAMDGLNDTSYERLNLYEFFAPKGVPFMTVHKWLKKHEVFNERYQFAKTLIGLKLNRGLLKKELSEKIGLLQMHNFMPGWKDVEAYHDERARAIKDVEQTKQNITVVMEPFPSSDKVPERKEE
jgi:hypothetical protein